MILIAFAMISNDFKSIASLKKLIMFCWTSKISLIS